MDKRYLHHVWRKLRPINQWYFLIAAVFFLAVSVYALRQNNLTAISLRDEVVAADKANKDVEQKLHNFRVFVYSHMNADLSSGGGVQHPIQLKYRYDRLVAAEKKRVEQSSGGVYNKAQEVCEQKFPAGAVGASGGGRIACIENYVTQNGGASANPIPDDLYKFNFVSPRWSPDLAGFSIILTGIFSVIFIIRFVGERWLRYELRHHE